MGRWREQWRRLSFKAMDHGHVGCQQPQGICVRAGQHCAQPLLARLGHTATARASFALYSDDDDIEALLRGLAVVRKVFG